MTDLRNRADLLKEHVKVSKQAAVDKFDKFAKEFMSNDKFDILVQDYKVVEL